MIPKELIIFELYFGDVNHEVSEGLWDMPDSSSALFNSILERAINEGLNILGDDSVKEAFFYHVKKRGLMRAEIPAKLEAFDDILTDLFGPGALVLELRIARRLHDDLNIEFEEHAGWTLAKYSECAKKASKASLTPKSRGARKKPSYNNDVGERVE